MSQVRIANDLELKRVIQAVGDLGVLVMDVKDGFKFKEIGEFLAVADDMKAVLADKDLLIPEWAALDEAARQDLIQYAKDNISIPANAVVEQYVEKIVGAAVAFSAVLQVLKS